jgi:hypothetical protein
MPQIGRSVTTSSPHSIMPASPYLQDPHVLADHVNHLKHSPRADSLQPHRAAASVSHSGELIIEKRRSAQQ